jgi:hypothetical protein
MGLAPEDTDHWSVIGTKGPAAALNNGPFDVILSLCVFERFVFVLSILEGQSDGDCLIVLRCSRREVVMARPVAHTWSVDRSAGQR